MASTQAPNLDSLPLEVLDNVLERLDVEDLQSARLVSRDVAAKSARRFFKNMTVTWTSGKQLRAFIEITKPDRPGCWLQHLTVIGVIRVSRPEHHKLLAEAFTNLRQNSASGVLRSISLVIKARVADGKFSGFRSLTDCDYPRPRDFGPATRAIARSFETVSHALAHSRLPIQEFDILTDTPRCSLPIDLIGSILDSVDLFPSLRFVKRLYLRVTYPLNGQGSRGYPGRWIRNAEEYRKHAHDLCRFVKLCAELETLDLEWYPYPRGDECPQQVCAELAQLQQLSQLRDCRLVGMETNEDMLSSLLQKTTLLRRLSLENIYLTQGTFTTVLQYMTSGALDLEYVYLSSLVDSSRNGAICFVEVVEDQVLCSNNNDYHLEPTSLTRVGEDTRKPIAYQYTAHPFGRATFGRRRGCLR